MLLYGALIIATVALYYFMRKKRTVNLSNNHCLITGGSSGIGLAIAIEASQLGANVTIIARSQARLEEAQAKISATARDPTQKVLTFSMDISDSSSDLEDIVKKAEECNGPITLLVNCAGTSICKRFEDTSHQDFVKMLDVNFLGSMQVTRAVLPSMKVRREGRIVFVSSLAGVIGLFGYSAYSGSKFALVGVAQALQMEVNSYNISVTVSLPPDTDTPGYAEEIKNKPIETSRICDNGGFFSAQEVATKTLSDALEGKFLSSVGLEGWMLTMLCSGTSPVKSFIDLLMQVLTMGIFRLALFVHLRQCDKTIEKCAHEKKRSHPMKEIPS